MGDTLYDYCKKVDRTELLEQWYIARNAPLTPQTVSYGSKQKVWWLCEKGHEWQAAVYTRTEGTGCPFCTGRRVLKGYNDLAFLHPEIAAQWHPTKNGDLTPDQVLLGSHRKIWWLCEKGHEWQASVKSRVSGCGCPVCANRVLIIGVNDLAATHPELVKQWHPTLNEGLKPTELVAGTRRKVWWICEKGHEWRAMVASRANGSGCPVCAGKKVISGENDLASNFPDIAAQWHPDKNGAQKPENVSPYSNRKEWWICERGHEYTATVSARTASGSGCPYCSGKKVLAGFNDLKTMAPKVAAQWHPTLNGTLIPEMVTAGSQKKVWWQCPEGHVWKSVIYSRAGPQNCGCPVCAGRVKKQNQDRYRSIVTEAKISGACALLK